jgi:hypothetical protein
LSDKLTQDRLKELLRYDSNTGIFIWLKSSNGRIKVGDIAGTINNNYYCRIMIDNKRYYAHKLVWLYVYGELPDLIVDHINGNRNDNRVANLRLAARSQNNMNSKKRTNNLKGTSYHKRDKVWHSEIRFENNRLYLGTFETQEAAHEAYKIASIKYHGEFSNIGVNYNVRSG